MSIKWKFIVWGSLFYSSIAFLLVQLLQLNKWYFVAGEVLLLLSIILFISLYKQLVKPIETISSAINLLKEKDFSTRLTPVRQKEIDQLIDVYNRMSEQLHMERVEHEEKNLFLERLIEASPSSILVLNKDRQILKANPAAKQLLGFHQTDDFPLAISKIPIPWNEKLSQLKEGESEYIKMDGIRRFKVSYNSFMDKGFANPFILIEEMTRELIQAEKQSYELVIRMMSHEVNNSVGAVNSVMQSVLNMDLSLNKEAKQAIEVSIDRNQSLNRFMSNFANVVKLPPPEIREVNIRSIVEKVLSVFSYKFDVNEIQLQFSFSGETYIQADGDQMEQVLMNIVKNSMEAIGKNGNIKIDLSEESLSIKDDGKGFGKEIQEKLFTPFFSTKNKGQGIGLTLVREVLHNHNFRFKLHRIKPDLTEFLILFK